MTFRQIIRISKIDTKDTEIKFISILLESAPLAWGHLCVEDFWEDDKEYEESFLMEIFEKDLQESLVLQKVMEEHGCADIDERAEEIIIEMVFQLGRTGVSKNFVICGKHCQNTITLGASFEMLDSKWAKQTPNQSQRLWQIK